MRKYKIIFCKIDDLFFLPTIIYKKDKFNNNKIVQMAFFKYLIDIEKL